jgi:hypothetical protein
MIADQLEGINDQPHEKSAQNSARGMKRPVLIGKLRLQHRDRIHVHGHFDAFDAAAVQAAKRAAKRFKPRLRAQTLPAFLAISYSSILM